MLHPNKIDFIYIVKIYVLKYYRGKNPALIEEEKVSEILFRQIDRKEINILTLESSCEKLDNYYEKLGFEYNRDISEMFSPIVGTNEKIIIKIVDR